MAHHLLFVCSGNICRSPMAEGITRIEAERRGFDVSVRSAGTLHINGRPADKHATAVCREIGVDISGHRSQGVSDELVEWADHILVMELHHAEFLRNSHEDLGDKVLMFGNFGGTYQISDPVGGWRYQFRSNRKLLQKCVEGLLERLDPA